MDSIATYLAMGGYAAFIWPAYAVTAVVMGGLAITSWRALKARETELRLLQEIRPSRRPPKQPVPGASVTEAAGDA